MSDIIQCFKIIETKIPYVVFNDDVDLQRQLDFFLNICKKDLESCPSVKVIFPMFYKLENWKEFSTLLINTDKYLSRYQGLEFNKLISKQLAISNKDKKYSFTKNILEKQNKTGNKDRYNVIISERGNDKFKIIGNKNMIFYFSTPSFHTIKEDNFQIINYNVISNNEELGFKIPTIPPKIDDILKPLFQPAFIHTLYLKKNQKIYYIFSNSVSKYKENTTEVETTYGLGGLFVVMEDIFKTSPKKEKELIEVLERITDKVSNRIINFYQVSIIKLQATRAAISQVMARNMSHNIGSHVLSKLLKDDQIKQIFFKNKGTDDDTVKSLEDINAILTNNKLFYQCLNALKDIDIEKSGENILSEDKNKETNESLLAYFFDYLKARMDYLADVTTSTPVMENTKGLYNDMVKPFIKNRVLNDRISGLGKFYYEITVCKPESAMSVEKKCEKINTKKECPYCVNDTNSNQNDIQLSIPNDVLGVQAFYTILENIIRNTAKHGTTPSKKELKNGSEVDSEKPFEFTIKVEEASLRFVNEQNDNPNIDLHLDEYYCISIFDNCDLNTETEIYPSKYTGEEAKKIEIYKEKKTCDIYKNGNFIIKKIDKLVIDQNHILNKSILENNQLRHGGWGLIEMDASAAYLRKIDVELIDSDEYSITDFHGENPVTEGNRLCIYQAYAEQEKYLGYRFFIRKPQEILVVGDEADLGIKSNNEDEKKELLKNLKNAGVWIYSKKELFNFLEGTKQKAFPHKLVVVVNDTNKEIIEKINLNKACFSKRILFTSSITSNNENIKNDLWKEYIDTYGIKNYNNTDGSYTEHGHDYCERKTQQFLEIHTSLTDHYFNQDFFVKSVLFYKYSWPIKIAVIDERIQSFSKERYKIEKHKDPNHKHNCTEHKEGVKYIDIYRKTNIFVPEENEANLNLQNFDEEYNKIISYIFTRTEEHKKNDENFGNGLDDKPCEFIVIHMGIIEKLISSHNKKKGTNFDKEKPEHILKFVKEVLLNNNEERYDSIVITSGRGKPHNLPPDIRYLNFSVVSNYMITIRNKFAFTEALYSARKQN